MSEFPCEFCRKADGVHATSCITLMITPAELLRAYMEAKARK